MRVQNKTKAFAYRIYSHFTQQCIHLNCWLQVIAAEGEQKASRALKEASEVIAQSSSALQLRYLQVTIWKNI